MLFKAPTQTPHFSTLLDDLPTRCSRQISKFLGISPATLARWARHGNAPRLAHLALFWESRWGIQTIELDVLNWRQVHLALIGSLERENAALREQLARVSALGSPGASNDPLWSANCERAPRPGAMARPIPPGQPPQPQSLPPLLWM